MLRNYFIIALRNLWKNRSYVLINTFGLGIALACCITAYMLLAFNLEFDSHLEDAKYENVYRVHTDAKGQQGQEEITNINAPLGMGPMVYQDISGVESYLRVLGEGGVVQYGDQSFHEGVLLADTSFFEFFDFEVISGSIDGFGDPGSVILSKKTAEKYFIDKDPIGEMLVFHFANDIDINMQVAAVVKDVPVNSSMMFDFLAPIEVFRKVYDFPLSDMSDWRDPALLLKVSEGFDAYAFPALTKKYVEIRNELKEDAKVNAFHVEPFLKPVNQDDVYWSRLNLRMSLLPIIVFVSMAALILLIACFNLTNITIATTAKRFKEVGVRKVMGATMGHVAFQFFIELLLTVLISLIVSLVLSKWIIGEFTQMWNLPLGLSDISGINLILALLVLVLITSTIAGIYPILANANYQPVQLLRRDAKVKGAGWVTKTLVTLQFSISVIVLINGLVFLQNTKFQENISYGYDMDEVITLFIQSENQYKIMKSRLQSDPRVKEVAITHHQMGMSSYPFPVKIDTAEYQVRHIEIGENFFETMGLKLVEGRFMDVEKAWDEENAIVVNEKFLEAVQIGEPLGSFVKVRDERKRIVGVVQNHVDNLFRTAEDEPFVYYASKRNEYKAMLVKAEKEQLTDIKSSIEEVWKSEFPDMPAAVEFQEELTLGDLRNTNNNLKKIFIFLTILGAFLSASGIYALASLHVEKRTKEIGVRKVLGSSTEQLVRLLSRQFAVILSLAVILGSSLGYFLSTQLLDNIYAYHVQVGMVPIIISSVIILFVGLVSTSSIIFRASRQNPVLSLRSE